MSTPIYIKETPLDKISNSRILEGCALLFYLGGKLKMKFPDGTIKDATGGSDINRFVIARPISDDILYPKFEASQTSDFVDLISVDPLNNTEDTKYLKVFDGKNWIEFPQEGLSTPFDRMEVSINVEKFSHLEQPYYIRYCWVTSEGVESNFRSAVFPSVSVSGSGSGEGGQITVDNALAYEDLSYLSDGFLTPNSDGFPVWIKTDKGNLYPIEKKSLIISEGYYRINPNPYLVYDNSSEFIGTWRVYFAGGVKGEKGEKGEKGDKGESALTINSPTTETLEAGNLANVEADFNESGVVTFKFQIPRGERGLNALTISDVIVNTLDNESEATVEATIDENGGVTFDFGIPKGNKGDKGDKGEKGDTSAISIGDNGNWFLDGVDTGKKATGQGSNAVLSITPPSETYDGMIWIQIESEEDNQFVNFESIDVVFGENEPENAPDGTIFIQE